MAQELQLQVDETGYERLMREHEEKSKGKATASQVAISTSAPLPATDDRAKWSCLTGEGTIQGWIANNEFLQKGKLETGEQDVGLLLDRTTFYAEQGGQVGDKGSISTPTGEFSVSSTTKLGNAVVHVGRMASGHLEVGQKAWLQVDTERDFTRKNHTVTHLLHWALHEVLGEHVEQRGSMVNPQKLTFDFSHDKPMTAEEKLRVEQLVNEKVYQDHEVRWRELPIAEARKLPGIKAFFGDKYGDTVRIVEIGDGFSREFCGGTHLEHTGQIGLFKIVGEETTGKGVRRITAITAREAVNHVQQQDNVLSTLLNKFRCQPQDLPNRIDAMFDEVKKLQQQLKKGAATDLQGVADKLFASATDVQGAKLIVGEMPAGPEEALRTQIDRLRQKAGTSVIVFGWSDEGKVGLLAAVTDDLVKKGLHAGKLVGQLASVVGGRGGGKPTLAQAGGKEPAKLGEALAMAAQIVQEQMKA